MHESIFDVYFKRVPNIIKPFVSDLIFDLPNDQNAVYVTFDDGPHPKITPRVLELLHQYNAKATFFALGKQAALFPEIVTEIRNQGHAVGMHGFEHLSGWHTDNQLYFNDLERCAQIIRSNLFRPPYGQITFSQAKAIKQNAHIIMWSHLSADWDNRYTAEKCAEFVTRKIVPGSIVVFHDSEKAQVRMLKALEIALDHYQNHGFAMQAITLPEIK